METLTQQPRLPAEVPVSRNSFLSFIQRKLGEVLVGVIVTILGGFLLAWLIQADRFAPTTDIVLSPESDLTTTANAVTQIIIDASQDQDSIRSTSIAQAGSTLTALAPNAMPTITLTPINTPLSLNDIQFTAQAEISATETIEASTQEFIAQETQEAMLTQEYIIGSTATYVMQLTLTPYLTNTSTVTTAPTNTQAETNMPLTATPFSEQIALTPQTSNANWEPYIIQRDFSDVTMVLVPAGRFAMGSTQDEIESGFEMCQQAANSNNLCQRGWYEDEAPNDSNTQIFTEPFWIDHTEVTRAHYQACVIAGVCGETPESDYSIEDNHPVNRVPWLQAKTYCEWRDARLPTEAEWEYAARGPDALIYPWGNEFNGDLVNHCDQNCPYPDAASIFDDGYAGTARVGSFPEGESWTGALDMSGNLNEWTSSEWKVYPYNSGDGREQDTNVSISVVRVLRGGSYTDGASWLRTAKRQWNNGENPSTGFRCARDFE